MYIETLKTGEEKQKSNINISIENLELEIENSIVFNNKINELPFPIKYKHIKDYKPVNIYILKHKTNNNLFIVDYTIQSLEEAIKSSIV